MSSFRKHPLLYLGALLASLCLSAASSFARDLYWTEQKQIFASDIDGGNVTLIFDGDTSSPPMGSYAVDIAVTNTHIYWSGHRGGDIWRANRDGGEATQLINGVSSNIHFLAIHEGSGKIYFSDYSDGIYGADLADGGNVGHFHSGSAPGAFAGLVLDSSVTSGRDELLWISASSTLLHRTVPEWWSTSDEAVLQGGNATYGLAFDAVSRIIYYTNFTDDTLRSYNLNTSEHELHFTPGMTSPLGVKLSPSGTHLLIAERGRGITGYQLSNGGYELLVAASDAHFGVGVTVDPGELAVPPPPPPPPPPPEDGDIIFQAHFEDDAENERPRVTSEGGVWTRWAPFTTPDAVFVTKDEENLFGYGPGNQFLRVENAIGSYLDAPLSDAAAVVTLSFDFIARRTTIDSTGSERNGFGFFGGGERQHLYSVGGAGGLRGGSGVQPVDERARADIVFNNTSGEIQYEGPDGTTHLLPSLQSAVWIDGEPLDVYSAFGRSGNAVLDTPIEFIRLPHFSSGDRHSIDLDNITVFMGAHVFKPLVEVPTGGYAGWQESQFPGETDPAIIGPDADPDGDGVKNLIEYALGRGPLAASTAGLPATGRLDIGGDQYLILTFTRPAGLGDIEYHVAASDDLFDWSAAAVEVSVNPGEGDTEEVVYRHPQPLNSGFRGFLRLEVTTN